MNHPIRGIPTVYRDIQFRSRLEAKWAAFFDLLGWPYQYEPFDLRGWIPDFLITGKVPTLVEVKPASEFPSEVADEIAATDPEFDVMIAGCSILNGFSVELQVSRPGWMACHQLDNIPTIGWLSMSGSNCTRWASAVIGSWVPYEPMFGFCEYPGNRQDKITGSVECEYSPDFLPGCQGRDVVELWNRAGNLVQWRGKQSIVS